MKINNEDMILCKTDTVMNCTWFLYKSVVSRRAAILRYNDITCNKGIKIFATFKEANNLFTSSGFVNIGDNEWQDYEYENVECKP